MSMCGLSDNLSWSPKMIIFDKDGAAYMGILDATAVVLDGHIANAQQKVEYCMTLWAIFMLMTSL
eukprot:scaffold1252_cov246-Chaetoceros_neogracile.AAC.3